MPPGAVAMADIRALGEGGVTAWPSRQYHHRQHGVGFAVADVCEGGAEKSGSLAFMERCD